MTLKRKASVPVSLLYLERFLAKIGGLMGLLFFSVSVAQGQPAGYSYGKQIQVQASQVAGGTPINGFVLLVSLTDNDLRTVSNGGHVESSQGYDIVFTLGDCSTRLDHQIEAYDPSTGTYTGWVRVPQLNATSTTDIHMYYGNASVSSDPSTPATWASDHHGVWHLNGNFVDATSSTYDGVNNGSQNAPGAPIASGRSFEDPNDWIAIDPFAALSSSFSISAWARTDDPSEQGQRIFCDDANNSNGSYAMSVGDPGFERLRFYIRGLNPVSTDSPGNTILSNTWHYCVAVFDQAATEKRMYVDGNLVNTDPYSGSFAGSDGNAAIGGELPAGETDNRFDGDIDEVRVTKSALSAERIQTQYNNQHTPSSFYTSSSEMTASNLCAALPIELLRFEGRKDAEGKSHLEWELASEHQVHHYEIHRSANGMDWRTVDSIPAKGPSSSGLLYRTCIEDPFVHEAYYRLAHQEMGGELRKHDIVHLEVADLEQASFQVHQQVADPDRVRLVGVEPDPEALRIHTVDRKNVTPLVRVRYHREGVIGLDIGALSKGVYLIRAGHDVQKLLIH